MLRLECKTFKSLSLEELHNLFALRSEVFVVEQDCVYQDIDKKDFNALHILGFDEANKLIAYSRILPKGDSYTSHSSIGRVVVHKEFRGKNFGHKLVEFCIKTIEEYFKETTIKISAQSHLVSFYNTHGFEKTGDEYLEDGIPHVAMLFGK